MVNYCMYLCDSLFSQRSPVYTSGHTHIVSLYAVKFSGLQTPPFTQGHTTADGVGVGECTLTDAWNPVSLHLFTCLLAVIIIARL